MNTRCTRFYKTVEPSLTTGSASRLALFVVGTLSLFLGFQNTASAYDPEERDSLRTRIKPPRADSTPEKPTKAAPAAAVRAMPLKVTVPISSYVTPSETDLLAEAGVEQNAEYEASIRTASRWLTQSLIGAERFEISKRCDLLVGDTFRSFPVTSKTLGCVPWAMERLAAARLWRKNRTTRPDRLQVVKTQEGWTNLRSVAFQDAFLRVDPFKFDDVLKLQEFAKKTAADCTYKGANAAVIARAESFLPDERVVDVLEDLYPAAFACLEPDDEGFERTHMRIGLLRLMRGELASARPALLLAAHAEDNSEEFRALFWLGVIDESNKSSASAATSASSSARALASSNTLTLPEPLGRNASWEKLRQKYPLTIHSVMASHVGGYDPMDTLVPGNLVNLSRRVGKGWTEFNTSAFLFELLAARQEQVAMSNWSQFVARSVEAPNTESSLFVAWSHHAAQNYRSAIAVLSRYFRETQNKGVSVETLNLAFPRPFSEEVMNATSKVDPVLVFALIRQESAFDPLARSGANALGLMQLLPSTARKWMAQPNTELFIPASNVRVGVLYMQELMRKYDGNAEHMLAAYNAGWKNLERWKTRFPQANALLFSDLIPFKETRTYVSVIMRNSYWYGRLMAIKNDKLAKTMVEKSSNSQWHSQPVHQLLELAWNRSSSSTALANLSPFYALKERPALARTQQVAPASAPGDAPRVGLSAKGLEIKVGTGAVPGAAAGSAAALQNTPTDSEVNRTSSEKSKNPAAAGDAPAAE